jgi:hypothetical protein
MTASILTLTGISLEIIGSFILSIEAIGFGRIEAWIQSLKMIGFRSTKHPLAPGELPKSNLVLMWMVGFPVAMVTFFLITHFNLGWYSWILVLFQFIAIYVLNRLASAGLARIAKLLKLLEEKTQQRQAGILGFLFLLVGFMFEFAAAFLPIIQSN